MAGGQATNSGINYQQRVAAWCLINQYINFDMSQFFDTIEDEIIIQKTHFETDKPIDDIQLSCKNNRKVYLQAKRKLSLSIQESSDFYKTFEQFILQHNLNSGAIEYYGLITTSESSTKVTNEVKKIVASVRLSNDALEDNPLNISEQDTLKKLQDLLKALLLKHTGNTPSDEFIIDFLKKVFISVIDIEAGHPVDIAALMLLTGIGFRNPILIWSLMIANTLGYASKRLSVDSAKLKEIFNAHLKKERDKILPEELKTTISSAGSFQVARDYLLIESFSPEHDLMLMELFRFTEDCQRKRAYSNGHLETKHGDKWKIIQRFATFSGFERYVKEESLAFKGKKLVIISATEDKEAEISDCANLHREFVQSLIELNSNILLCLHCGKPVLPENSLIIEIDDLESAPAFGLAHVDCIRPVDRIMGKFKMPDHEPDPILDSFDFKLWVSLILKGQGLLNYLKSAPQLLQGQDAIISWNSFETYDNENSYCIKFNLEDGSSSYAYQRGRIERLNKPEAQVWLGRFQKTLADRKENNNPYCVLSESRNAGTYSQLLLSKKKGEKILEIKSIEVARYSIQIAKLFDRDIFHYAPLCLARDRDTEQIFNISNIIPLVSDPLSLSDFLENWSEFVEVDNLELKIIKSDQDFDSQMRMIFRDGFFPILDPLFDKNFKLVSGFPIHETEALLAEAKLRKMNADEEIINPND